MGTRPTKQCALCLKTALLCKSHLIPAGLLALLRNPNAKNPYPVQLNEFEHFSNSKQPQDYLLCEKCESAIRKNGEDWVLAHCFRGKDKPFRLQQSIRKHPVAGVFAEDGTKVFRGREISEVDTDKLIYFGVSIFWRAATHTWRISKRTLRIDLGPYTEGLRRFLNGGDPFPKRMALVLFVSTKNDDSVRVMHEPASKTRDGFHTHHFSTAGLHYCLYVGQQIPEYARRLCLAPANERFVGMSENYDALERRELNKLLTKHRLLGLVQE